MYFVGVDVGSKSVRAALFSGTGKQLKIAVSPISVYNYRSNFYEQSSNEIWKAVCSTVKNVVSKIDKDLIKGIGFDATCSLVVLDKDYLPNSVSVNDVKDQEVHNVIMWMDHRAKAEADTINSKSYDFLKYVGGKISLEMQMPKILWLKNNLENCWNSAEHFFDLPDFLTFKATGSLTRSLCSLVCKWTYFYNGQKQEWNKDFFLDMDLQRLMENDFEKLGKTILAPGELVGCLSKEAAQELDLAEETAVGVSIIDAHAGGLALIFSGLEEDAQITRRLGLIGGTSTCHMTLSQTPIFVPGVWGPYHSAMVSEYWLNEGGQSATGSLVDHIIFSHPAANKCPKDKDVYSWLESILKEKVAKENVSDVSLLTHQIHVYPDFHGNRSPLADSTLKGMICGLTLDDSEEGLALLYLATLQALAYGTRDIITQMVHSGHEINTLLMCGGLRNSEIFVQMHADVLDMPVMIPHTKESVLLGATMLGAAASGVFGAQGDLTSVARALAGKSDNYSPIKELHLYHNKKFEVFKRMQEEQMKYKQIMNS